VLTDAGVELPLPGQSASTTQTRLEYGKSVQGRIVGDDAVAARLTDTPAEEVHFQRYLAANCFGDTVGRRGIDLQVRELLTFSMLVALVAPTPGPRAHQRKPQSRQYPRTTARRIDRAGALHRLPPHPQRLAALNDITAPHSRATDSTPASVRAAAVASAARRAWSTDAGGPPDQGVVGAVG